MNTLDANTKQTEPARIPLAPAAFSVSARVAMQLGRESVSSSNTAIVELVKNAYDADAREVTLRFTGLGTPEATLMISDNGHGMTEEELRDHWLCIGTTNKQDTRRSKEGRVQTGEKGLGRLGLDRLCQRTTLQTRRKLTSEEQKQPELFPNLRPSAVELEIHWDRYQVRGQRLETIAHEVYSLDHLDFDPVSGQPAEFPNGTRMILRGLKDTWSKERIKDLADELSLMLSPFGDKDDFAIKIVSGLAGVDEQIAIPDELLGQATWRVEARIESVTLADGKQREEVSMMMSSPQHPRTYELGALPWHDWMGHGLQEQGKTSERSRCGPTKLVFHVFIQKNDDDYSAQIRSFLTANRGIRIYRDGFRVKPYGDPKGTNDWLALSMRRAQNPAAISRKGWKLAYHQVIGAVLISRLLNSSLEDQTNREGLLEGDGFADLTAFASKVVSWFEGKASEDFRRQNPKQPKETKATAILGSEDFLQQAQMAVEELAKTVAASPTDPSTSPRTVIGTVLQAVKAARAAAESDTREHKEEVAELHDEINMVRSLASVGIMAAFFGHERVGDAVSVRQKMAELRRLIKDPNDSLFSNEAEKLETVDLLEAGVLRLESFARFALDTVRPWKRTEPPADLVDVIHRSLMTFREALGRSGITVQPEDTLCAWKSIAPLPVLGRTVQWEGIVTNLMVNALWALRSKAASQRIIRLSLELVDGFVLFGFEDSGIGLEAGSEGDVFRPGFSTKRDHLGKQEGTGLGLTLVRSFVEEAGGTITVKAKGELGGARFDIKAPLRQS